MYMYSKFLMKTFKVYHLESISEAANYCYIEIMLYRTRIFNYRRVGVPNDVTPSHNNNASDETLFTKNILHVLHWY